MVETLVAASANAAGLSQAWRAVEQGEGADAGDGNYLGGTIRRMTARRLQIVAINISPLTADSVPDNDEIKSLCRHAGFESAGEPVSAVGKAELKS